MALIFRYAIELKDIAEERFGSHLSVTDNCAGQFFTLDKPMTDEFKAVIEKDRAELSGTFCRGCGYCMPCPVDISIRDCARMSLMLRRAPSASWLTDKWQQEMHKIENCIHCYSCASKCPYGLDTPEVLQANYQDYWQFLEAFKAGK